MPTSLPMQSIFFYYLCVNLCYYRSNKPDQRRYLYAADIFKLELKQKSVDIIMLQIFTFKIFYKSVDIPINIFSLRIYEMIM